MSVITSSPIGGSIEKQSMPIFIKNSPPIIEIVNNAKGWVANHVAANKLIIISKAYPTNAKKSKEILKLYRLDEYFNSIIFCEKNEDKAKIAEAMHVEIMIDDKEEVLKEFPKTIKTILFKKKDADKLLGKLL